MADEFTLGIRAKKQLLTTRARATVPSADTKPEAQIRYRGDDSALNQAMDRIQRSLETVQGARGSRADHGVTFRALDSVFQNFEQKLQFGSTQINSTTTTADTADANAAQALLDAAAALALAQTALDAANEAHTGEVTSIASSRVLSLDVSSITNQIDVEAQAADDIVIHDDSDGTIKKINLSSITDGGSF